MKLIYIANARIPTEKAHGIQIFQMLLAFVKSEIRNPKSEINFDPAGHHPKGDKSQISNNKLDVELVIPSRFNKIKTDPFEYYGIEKVFEIIRLPCIDLIPFRLFLGNLALWIETVSFLLCFKICFLFKKYDILYTREEFVGLFFKNFILEIHSLPKKIKFFHIKNWQRAKFLIVLTSFIKNKLVEAGISEDKILVAPDGVNLEDFDIDISKDEARKKLNLPQDKILIGYVGMLRTLGMEKGIDTAVKSLKFLADNILLVLVGGCEKDIKFYLNLAKNLDLENRVIFVGRVAHKEIPFYLKAFDILIAPFPENEHYKFYMSPLKIFEYMAAERPILVSDLPSIREVLDENGAFLFRPGDEFVLARNVKEILNNYASAMGKSRNAREKVNKFIWDKRAGNIINFIQV